MVAGGLTARAHPRSRSHAMFSIPAPQTVPHGYYNTAMRSALDRIQTKHSTSGLSGVALKDAIAKDIYKLQDSARVGLSAGLRLYGDEATKIWNRVFSVA